MAMVAAFQQVSKVRRPPLPREDFKDHIEREWLTTVPITVRRDGG
jgi:hypothetical protein